VPPSKTFDVACLDLAEAAASRVDQWRISMLLLSAGSLPSVAEDSFLGRELRGAAVVATMAELEHLLRETLGLLADEVNASGTPVSELVDSLRVLAAHPHFESLSATTKMDERWDKRDVVTRLHVDSSISSLPPRTATRPQPPLDGRTIKPVHVRQVWKILGLPGSPFPSNRAATALTKLGAIRNDIAHRNVSISDVFLEPGKTASHLADYLDQVVLFLVSFGVELEAYAQSRSWHV